MPPPRGRYNLPVIHVIATIELRPDNRDRFLEELAAVAPQVRTETGCIDYGAAIDVASGLKLQVPPRADVVTVVERWSSLDALAAHAIAPHMLAFRARTSQFVLRTLLQVLAAASL